MSDDADSLDRAIHEEVRLAAYAPRWASQYLAERDRLSRLFPVQILAIEHIGSTAVPGMPAKPIIDLLAAVGSMATADALVAPLLNAGYTTSAQFNAALVDRRWFMRAHGGRRTHHLHVVVLGTRAWTDRLCFRDRLRADAGLAQEYALLKVALATRHRSDREGYTEAKSDFVARVLGDA